MKLVYFNARGLAETSRLLLAVNSVDYEDFRYPLKINDWATHDMERVEFLEDKENNKLLGSLNKLPFLVVDDQVIPQSKSVERFLAKKYNMFGDNDVDAGRIDGICEYVRDFKDAYQSVRKLKDEEKEKGMEKWFSETLPEKLKLLDNILCKEHELFSVGTHLSLADVVLYNFITQFFDNKDGAMNSTQHSPKLAKIINHVGELDSIKKWLKTRPETSF